MGAAASPAPDLRYSNGARNGAGTEEAMDPSATYGNDAHGATGDWGEFTYADDAQGATSEARGFSHWRYTRGNKNTMKPQSIFEIRSVNFKHRENIWAKMVLSGCSHSRG